jgi:hypothetical protein
LFAIAQMLGKRAGSIWCLVVSSDPEKPFAEAADYIIYQPKNLAAWLSAAGAPGIVRSKAAYCDRFFTTLAVALATGGLLVSAELKLRSAKSAEPIHI